MGLKESVMQVAAGLFVERPARAKSLGEWKTTLETDGVAVDQRAAAAKDPEQASKVLRHISGIERWGQRRLQDFPRRAATRDEYDDYRPGTDLTLAEQREFFRQTRAETVALVDTGSRRRASAMTPRSLHNDFGLLSGARLAALPRHARQHGKQENSLTERRN